MRRFSKARRIPDETIRDLWDADLFYLLKPKKFGGPAVRPDIAFQVADELGRGDGAVSWIWAVMTIHDQFASLYPEQFQQEYWAKDRKEWGDYGMRDDVEALQPAE